MSPFDALREQLLGAAAEFGGGQDAVAGILIGMVDDVDRALGEELEIFPVCHHSPASGLAMVRRLREKQPSVIYLELCEDFAPLLEELRNCRLPVALQAFAGETGGAFPPEWSPLSVVAPLTQASAEYQAISYALDTPGVELVLVDRSTDHVFQWMPREAPQPADTEAGAEAEAESDSKAGEEPEGAALHGDAVGIGMGDLRPHFRELEEHLLHHGRVRHWSEWWDQYVEQPLANADYATYRQVMVMIGSLFRRLRRDRDEERDEARERYMWTRMREHLAATGADPHRCVYVCGAFHAASRVEQFGLASDAPYEISPRTQARWQYGMIPSSHSAIEAQFGLAPGSVSIAAATWAKELKRGGLKPFALHEGDQDGKPRAKKTAKRAASGRQAPKNGPADSGGAPVAAGAPGAPPAAAPAGTVDRLSGYIGTPPRVDVLDEEELLGWCVDIVALARRNGYLASTADAIAVYDTSILLAGMRGRRRPTPYDFQDAAITCIEKDTVPGRRDVRRLCEILLGGDRIGRVGYASLPPLARDVLDRLEPLGLDLERRSVQRALLDFGAAAHLRPCSDLLWILRRLLPPEAARPIMGSRGLGERPIQESWDLALGKHQRELVELGYEGVSVEQVLEQRLRKEVYAPDADPAVALGAVEEALVFLGGRRLADDLGARAVELLALERSADRAPEVLKRIRRLLAHFRTEGQRLPGWCEDFATKGYAHYCTLLPAAFADENAGVRQVGAMLGFLFGMESLALSLGCDHAQLEIAVKQSHPEAPGKVALLWAARFQLGELTMADLRALVRELVDNPLVVPALPQYLSGMIQALDLAPALAPLVVETLSRAFARLPDTVLLPWLPKLIAALKDQAAEYAPLLVREAGRTFPGTLAELDTWTAPWDPGAEEAAAGLGTALEAIDADAGTGPVAELLRRHPAAAEAIAALLAG